MWFKQAQLLGQLKAKISAYALEEKLAQLLFSPCLPHLPVSQGWVSPTDQEALVYSVNNTLLICLQTDD